VKVGVLQHLLQAQHVRSDLLEFGDDPRKALRPVVLIVPEIERHDRERVGLPAAAIAD
jgi:hypothetical protein